jgi:hypothetical protein
MARTSRAGLILSGSGDPGGDESQPPVRPVPRTDVVVLAAAALAGVLMRVWVLGSPLGSLTSDEAIVGLMARHALADGQITAFFWGQPYGGSLEPLLAAGVFAVAGSSTIALKMVPLLLSVAATLLIVPLGRRLAGDRVARYAAAAFWVSAANFVWWSTKAVGFYWSCLILGLLFLLLVIRLVERPEGGAAWTALGLVGGLGWWTSPQFLHFAIPGLLWLVWRLRGRVVRGLAIAAVPALLGAAPWIWHNVRLGFPSLGSGATPPVSFLAHMKSFVVQGVPVALGLDQTIPLPGRPLVWAVYLGLGAATAVALLRRPPRTWPWLLLLVVGLYPFVYSMFPTVPIVGEGRYLLYLGPFLWLLVLGVAPKRAWVLPVALVPMLALTAVSLVRIRDVNVPIAPDVRMPNDDRALVAFLDDHGVTHLVANYWIAYRLAFETHERIIATPVDPGQNRFQPFADAVLLGPPRPYAFVRSSRNDRVFREKTAGHPWCYRRHLVDRFVVYLPNTALPPEQAAGCPRVQSE